jgi:hypothetical protein
MKKALAAAPAAVVIALLVLLVYAGPDPRLERAVRADATVTTLMNAQSLAGPGLASVWANPTPGDTGIERHSFQYVPSAIDARVRIDQSNDGGTTWTQVHLFDSGSATWDAPACGACKFRTWKLELTTSTASVYHNASGVIVPLAPTYTPTRTFTSTRTPTATLTPTVTRTFTSTFTPDLRTPTPDPLSITPSATPTRTITLTPTITSTRTRTQTFTVTLTPTITYTPTIDWRSLTPAVTPTFTAVNTSTPTRTPTRTLTPTTWITHVLTVTMAGTGAADETVTVSGGAWGGTCVHGTVCTFNVPNGLDATVTQTAGTDLGTWSGGVCTGTTSVPCVVSNMTAAKAVTATY